MDEQKTNIEYEIADVIIGRPQEFKVGRKAFRLYPITLAKMFLLKRQLDGMGINDNILKMNPYLEAIRVARESRDVCCHVLAYLTAPNTYKELYNSQAIITRKNYFIKSLSDEELASLMIIALTSDKTEEIMKHIGLDKEKERMERVMVQKSKSGKNNLTFNGLSILGTFIGQLKEMGYSDDEILYEKGYSYLRLMLADKVVSIFLSDEERQNISTEDGGTLMDAGNPEMTQKIFGFFEEKGIHVQQ